jgi:hypothetical protein
VPCIFLKYEYKVRNVISKQYYLYKQENRTKIVIIIIATTYENCYANYCSKHFKHIKLMSHTYLPTELIRDFSDFRFYPK